MPTNGRQSPRFGPSTQMLTQQIPPLDGRGIEHSVAKCPQTGAGCRSSNTEAESNEVMGTGEKESKNASLSVLLQGYAARVLR